VIPGEVIFGEGPIEINPGAPRLELEIVNTGDRPVQVGSHVHVPQANAALEFDRAAAHGHRFDPQKVVLDPYAKTIGRDVRWCDEMFGYKVGDPVLGFARGSGSYAEYAVIPVNVMAKKPKSLSYEEAAGVPIAGETAWRSLHEASKVQKGHTVLIHGAAGGVGSAAVQVAKAAGAKVIGTASANNHDFLKSLGVDQVIDYRSQKFEDVVKNADIVLNTANMETNSRSIGVVKKGGSLVSIVGPPDAAACAAAGIICGMPDRATGGSSADMMARVGELADAGKFKVFVEQKFSMEEAQQAWEKSRAGHTRGKLIIVVSEGPTMKHQ